MAEADSDSSCFPLKNMSSVVEFFSREVKQEDPNLAKLSIILGFYESALTCKGAVNSWPTLDKDTFEALYSKFTALVERDFEYNTNSKPVTREIVKGVSDLVWSCLSKSYFKDKPHIQNIYSFLTGNRLDCFGVALAVVAVCQALGYSDVHLALSEDHAWVLFDKGQTAEVTWHGKGNEDKRGKPVMYEEELGWLYLHGYPVKCTRHTEVAAMVSIINPHINATTDSKELAQLQQDLLWSLHGLGHLKNYPMAICSLADLEEISASPGKLPAEQLFKEAVSVAKTTYADQHVYPYTYLGGFYYRQKKFLLASESWVDAAYVAGKYNYTKEDEEMYKELYEIATDFIPNILKQASSRQPGNDSSNTTKSMLEDSQFFANVLMFYDGVCLWEEDSQTPVLHTEWAKKLVQSVSKFTGNCRSALEENIESKGTANEPSAPEIALVKEGSNLFSSNNSSESVKNNEKVKFSLRSAKMKGMKSLLTTDHKLNTSAIKLQLTAQSQVSVPKSRRRSSFKTADYLYDYEDEIEAEERKDDEKRRKPKRSRDNDDEYFM